MSVLLQRLSDTKAFPTHLKSHSLALGPFETIMEHVMWQGNFHSFTTLQSGPRRPRHVLEVGAQRGRRVIIKTNGLSCQKTRR